MYRMNLFFKKNFGFARNFRLIVLKKISASALPCPVCQKNMNLHQLGKTAYYNCDFHGTWMYLFALSGLKSVRIILNEIYEARRTPLKTTEDKILSCPR